MILRLQAAPLAGAYQEEDHWIWCGSVIQGEDKKYHMFASRWSKQVPFTPNWLTHSQIVHAVSETPAGPYRIVEEILRPRGPEYWDGCATHNPTIHKVGDLYVLFYTGMSYRGELGPRGEVSEELRVEARGSQRIGFATATSPNGPWTRSDAPCLEARPGHWDAFMTTNPAPCVLPDGRIHLMYKSTHSNSGPIQYGVAQAASLYAPFERLGADAPITFTDPSLSYEDAYIWHQYGCFHMIFNDLTGKITGEDHAGAYARSEDGIVWELAANPKAYSRTIRWEDGSESLQGSFERPQLLIEEGRPTHLFAATANGPGGFAKATHTWNMVIPLACSPETL